MSLFGNQNFINQIIKEIGLSKVNEETCEILQALVEIETRKLIQHSAKFMNSDHRDQMNFQDVQNALTDLNHTDIVLTDQEEKYLKDGSTFIRSDPLFKTAKDFIEEQTKLLPLNLFSSPSLKGRWIYIDGKIPKTGENQSLKSKTDILSVRNKALKEKDKKFNVISDCPENLFTTIEEDYFKDVTSLLASLSVTEIGKLQDIDIGGNITNLSPMLLNYFNSTEITEAKMIYFLKMLDNKYFQKSIEYYLHQILAYLWAYEGCSCFKVGLKIAELISRFSEKYSILFKFEGRDKKEIKKLDMFERDTLYATTIKRIGVEFAIGLPADINDQLLELCQVDAKDGNMLAIQLKEVIHQFSSQINSLSQQLSIFSIPEAIHESHLMMPW